MLLNVILSFRQVTPIALSSGMESLTIMYSALITTLSLGLRVPYHRPIHVPPMESTTAVGFREPTDEILAMHLFIAATNLVLVYPASGRRSRSAASEVHEAEAALGWLS